MPFLLNTSHSQLQIRRHLARDVTLAARYDALVAGVTGTALGMMLANVPAVYFGETVARRVSMRWVHGVSALIFLLLGVLTLLNPAQLL